MLKSLDILIGFSVIMLVVSMSVTVIIQWIVNRLGMRGKELLKGLTALLQQLDPGLLTGQFATDIATRILTHPMLARSGEKLAGVVQREELIQIVLEIAAGATAQPAPPIAATAGNAVPLAIPPAPATAEQALAMAVARMGIPNPGDTLNAVRMFSMRLEGSRPDIAAHVRESMAVIAEAESQFVAKVNAWFDGTMDRVSQSFSRHSRFWTALVSLILALVVQLDSFKIVNRLAMDTTLRTYLVQTASQPPDPSKPVDDKATQDNLKQLRLLASDNLITWPDSWDHWKNGWSQSSIFGVLLSAALLSLGAPFWFNTLGELTKLRPLAATKDDQQRLQRESTQTETAAAGAGFPAAIGERGDPPPEG